MIVVARIDCCKAVGDTEVIDNEELHRQSGKCYSHRKNPRLLCEDCYGCVSNVSKYSSWSPNCMLKYIRQSNLKYTKVVIVKPSIRRYMKEIRHTQTRRCPGPLAALT